jgi:hypothetical protein
MEQVFFVSVTQAAKYLGAGAATIGVVEQEQVLVLFLQVY